MDGGTLAGPVPPRPALTGETVLALVHTSGTTGRAKAIPLRHGALMMSVADFAIEIGDQVAGSRHLQILPLFHLGGFGQCMQAILTAGTVYLHTAFVPAAVIDAIEADRIEFFTAGPSLIDMLVAEIRRRQIMKHSTPTCRSLREIAYGTAPITPSSLTAAVAAFGCRFRQIYGNTESQSMISLLAPEDHLQVIRGWPAPGRVSFGWEVRIVDPDGRDLPFDAAGELLIRGECLFSGYWRDPKATAAAFADGGWYRTGDIARLTADGYLYILDRAKDMIISGGENIYPAEVEAVLARHPAVADVAVLGRPDPTWGEAVHAVIIPAAGPSRPKRSSPGAGTGWRTSSARRAWSSPTRCPGRPPARCSSGNCGRSSSPRASGRPCERRGEKHAGKGSGLSSRRTAGCRRPGSASWPGPPSRPASARCSSPRATATRWRCATRSRPRPAGPGGDRGGERGAAAAGAGGQDRGAAGPGGRRPVHPRPRGGNQVMNTRFGLPPFAPLAMIEEYVNVIRSVLNRTAGYDGQLFRTGMVPLDSPPVRANLPVWLGALGPRMLELAGRIADGVILNLMTPAQTGQAAGVVRAAARAAGRDPASIEVACVIHLCLSDDPAAAAAAAREVVPRYVLHPATPRLFGELDGGSGSARRA